MQWALLYLTDGKNDLPSDSLLGIATAPEVCQDQIYRLSIAFISYGAAAVVYAFLPMCADDLLQLLERCKSGLKEDGLVIIKENVCEQGFVVDQVRRTPFPL